jgi:agmatinase
LGLADWGDVQCGANVDGSLDAIADVIEQACGQGLPLLIGGEHTASVGAVRGALRCHPDLQVIQVDAHADLRDEYEGLRTSHATVMRRIADAVGLDHICQYGIRSGIKEEFELAQGCLYSGAELALTRQVRDQIHRRPVYLTIDIDVLDPSCAPGTGCPEPGGPTFRELLSFVYSLQGLQVIGVDVMEVLPAADVNDITSIAAAKLIREAALLFGGPRSPSQVPVAPQL